MVDELILYDLYLDEAYDLIDLEGNWIITVVILSDPQSN